MAIRIQQLRVSFVWFERFANLLEATVPANTPLVALGRRPSYEAEFEQARTRTTGLTLPWRRENIPRIHYFWYFYLNKAGTSQVPSVLGWKLAVPLRTTLVPKVTAWPTGRVHVEGYHYPHGIALLATIALVEDLTLKQMVDKAVEARHFRRYDVTWPNGSKEQLSFEVLANQTLEYLRLAALGPQATAGELSDMPFSIATVIKGAGASVDRPVSAARQVHRALEGLCSWHQTWAKDQTHDLVASSLHIRHAPKAHLLYKLERGRAVWFPESFLPSPSPQGLGCYHRNLTLLSLQTEAILALMLLAAEYLKKQPELPAALEDFVRGPAGLLGRLHGGIKDTYRSRSPRAQIVDSQLDAVVNQVRAFYHMEPLK